MSILDLFKPDVIDGEVDDDAITVDFDTVYKRAQREIAARQNENYADPEAAKLQTWLGEFVVGWFRGGK